MSSQSLLEWFKEARITRNGLISLSAGIVVGLALGLLIGWVWWPVEWKGAGLDEMRVDAKAAYMAAVADTYVAYGSEEAALLAAQRLAPLGDLSTSFDEAVTFFQSQPNSELQIDHLARLAAALGVPISGQLAVQAPEAPTTPEETAATPAASAGQESGGLGWLGRLLAILVALALIGGGIYGLWIVSQRRSTGYVIDDVASQPFEHEEFTTTPASVIQTTDPRAAPDQLSRSGPAGSRPSYTGAISEAGPPPFEDEEAEDDGAPGPTSYYKPTPYVSHVAESSPIMDTEEEEFDADAVEVDYDMPEVHQNNVQLRGAQPAAGLGLDSSARNARSASLNRFARYPTMDRDSATYRVGEGEFSYTHNVVDEDGNYLGEFGIGVSERHGVLNNDRDKVVALEVYLFDKSDESQITTVGRTLLSEYAHDHLYKHFEQNRQHPPITAQRGTEFALEGRRFVLLCAVGNVEYGENGIFRTATVDMELKRKV